MLAERCYAALDHDRVRFNDRTGRCAVVRDISDALEDLNAFRGRPRGTLRLNAARQSAQLALMPVVHRFLRAHPDVHVEVRVEDSLTDIVAAGFDAGVRFGESIAADMLAVPIGPRQRSAIVGSPEYFTGTPCPLRRVRCASCPASATGSSAASCTGGSWRGTERPWSWRWTAR